MKSLTPNTLLQNRYLIVHLIGKGGMGDVYLAVDQRLGSAVALKRTFFADDEMLGNAFEREAKTLARLRHPVLPKVSDHFTENGEQYLVMEHISGDDLSKRLEAMQKPFPLSWVLFWADHLLDALAYLHGHEPSIIHRDIKPQNLKLTDENHIILLDFGLSKNNTGDTRALSTGSTGSVVGYTPHYAPMEQIRGTGTNPKSDIYALSATLYQLMTNSVPSDALTRADALLNDMSDPLKPLTELNNEVPKPVSDVILKGLEISQDRRFSSAREMQKALRDAFASMQNAMSADTVAFNTQSEPIPPIPQSISSSNEKTEVLNIPPAEILPLPPLPATPAVNTPPTNQNFASPNQTNSQEQNFDATLRMDSPLENNLPKQSNVQTEVFLAGSTPAINEIQQEKSLLTDHKTHEENFALTENFSNADTFGEKKNSTENGNNFTPEATVPLFTYDNQETPAAAPNDSEFFTASQLGGQTDAFATYTPQNNATGNFSQNEPSHESFADAQNFNSQPPVQPAPAPKKSSGKVFAAVAGLGALLILGAAAIGGGWYYYQNVYLPGLAAENPTPSPMPSLEVTPMPTVTPEIVTETNSSTNTEVGNNSNSSLGNLSNTETNTNVLSNTPNATPTPVRENTPRPTPIKTPVKATPIPTVKQTPKTAGTPIGVQ